MNEDARDEVAEGFRYTHFRADANTSKLLEIASFLYAAIELLSQKGFLDIGELDGRKKDVAARLADKFAERGMGVVYQRPEQDKYSFESAAKIDCEKRISLCKAACCKLPFALSKQDVEEGIVRWDFSRPYIIAHQQNGYCQHLDQEKQCCSVYAHRPVPCRGYDCRKDQRIWLDFEKRVINPNVLDANWPACLATQTSAGEEA